MSDLIVASLSAKKIQSCAANLRYVLGFGNSYVPNMCGILEHHLPNLVPQYEFAVLEQIELEDGGYAEGQTEFDPPRITLRVETYLLLVQDNPRARFTAAHEIGHLLLHEGLRTLNRMPEKSVAKFRSKSAEWQANEFAAAFLAPEHLLRGFQSPEEAAEMMRVSLRVAQIRMTELGFGSKDRDISAWTKLRAEMELNPN